MNSFYKMRQRAGLKQVDVCLKLNVSQTAISMWETGKSFPQSKLLPKIAALYNCSIDDLFNDKGD